MPIETALTRHLGLKTPILSAPMAGIAGGALAAAVSSAGGLGFIGGGYGDRDWPPAWTIRTLRNEFYDAYADAPKADLSGLRQAYAAAQAAGDVRTAAVIVGEAVDQVRGIAPAADIVAVARLTAEAEARLRRT